MLFDVDNWRFEVGRWTGQGCVVLKSGNGIFGVGACLTRSSPDGNNFWSREGIR
jgi:hypothetical protein